MSENTVLQESQESQESQLSQSLQALFDGTLRNSNGEATSALLVYGAPNTGKTRFAVRAAIAGYKRWPNNVTAMCVQNRTLAARIDNIIIREIGVSEKSRPVGTLSSLAFRIISAFCLRNRRPAPKLLNGAEQDALLRRVVLRHIRHVERGDNGDCSVCALFRDYFGTPLWVSPLTLAGAGGSADFATATSAQPASTQPTSAHQTASASCISGAFMHQLRDMLARLDELGVSDVTREQAVLGFLDFAKSHAGSKSYAGPENVLPVSVFADRRNTQWRLVFALRNEYRKLVAKVYNDSFRLDASELLIEGAKAARELGKNELGKNELGKNGLADFSEIPALLVVDDFQDITLAGLSFVETLLGLGTRLLLLANPDESVQSFRGAHPDYAISAALNVLQAAELSLKHADSAQTYATSAASVASATSATSADSASAATSASANRPQAPSMRDLLAARVSLSLSSQLDSYIATPNRPWKMPAFAGAFPVQSLNQLNNIQNSSDSQKYLRLNEDGTVNTALYRSQREELDAVIWQMKREHVKNRRKWNDMALIAHDNSTVRFFGEQLRADGVPVRYSLVTRPLKDEPFVKGLFALIELSQLAKQGIYGISSQIRRGRSLANLADFVRSSVQCIMDSPLAAITRGDSVLAGFALAGFASADSALASSAFGADSEKPTKLKNVESLMRSIASLSAVLDSQNVADNSENNSADASICSQNAPLRKLINTWDLLRSELGESELCEKDFNSAAEVSSPEVSAPQVSVDNSYFDGNFKKDLRSLSLDACYLLCIADVAHFVDSSSRNESSNSNSCNESSTILNILQNMSPKNPHVGAFVKMWENVRKLALRFKQRPDLCGAKYALGEAWNICNVAERWQRAALQHNRDGYRANDRLDAAMRLFDYVSSYDSATSATSATSTESAASAASADSAASASSNILDFIAQIRGMEIEADSLARVAPVPDAVTLTTPAGSVGNHWPLVWMPTFQQGVWPNLASRSTMFGAESLTNLILNNNSLSNNSLNKNSLNENRLNKDYLNEESLNKKCCGAREKEKREGENKFSSIVQTPQQLHYISGCADCTNGSDNFSEIDTKDFLFILASNDKSSVFSGEQRSFLLAITRATERLHISAQCSDSACPSDFLYYYLPERYYNNGDLRTPFTDFKIPFAGLDMDVRGLVCAARAQIVRAAAGKSGKYCEELKNSENFVKECAGNEKIYDAAKALSLLREHGVDCADYRQWDFMSDVGEDSAAPAAEASVAPSANASKNRPVVSLSPSAVDNMWACPVCGLIGRQFAGPQPGSAASYFGTLIHETARWASEDKHYDIPETFVEESEKLEESDSASYSPYASKVSRINSIANLMIEHYESIAPELADVRNAKEHYSALSRQSNISRALHSIAQYLVTSYDQSSYNLCAEKDENGVLRLLTGEAKCLPSSIGELKKSYCELPTSAHFGFDDVTKVVNNTLESAGLPAVTVSDVFALLGALVGGWPDGACEDLQVHIHGRIDRLEKRKNADGSQSIRLLDYKTGKPLPASGVFNDLQLVCYQLALLFADKNPLISAANPPIISRSVLFHVVSNDYPAQDHGVAENVYQPPLCVGNSLNNAGIESRVGFRNMMRLTSCPEFLEVREFCPKGMSEQAWESFLKLHESAQWSLTMIARVFYAAAAVRSKQIVAHPTSAHVQYCRSKQVCPACAGRIDTVYEVR